MTYRSPHLLEFKRGPKQPVWAGKGYVPSKYAAFHSDDLVFRRTQSPAMAAREWERESLFQRFFGLFQSKGKDHESITGGRART